MNEHSSNEKKPETGKYCVVLAMHGAPPIGFPQEEIMELMSLHHRLHGAFVEEERARIKSRHDELEEKVCRWPRTPENDPFYAASISMAESLSCELDKEVFVGFNEFCAPTIAEAIAAAAEHNPERIIVITPMMTPGGEHSERDIPAALDKAGKRFPDIEILYAWPFPQKEIASFLASQIRRFNRQP